MDLTQLNFTNDDMVFMFLFFRRIVFLDTYNLKDLKCARNKFHQPHPSPHLYPIIINKSPRAFFFFFFSLSTIIFFSFAFHWETSVIIVITYSKRLSLIASLTFMLSPFSTNVRMMLVKMSWKMSHQGRVVLKFSKGWCHNLCQTL